MTVTTIETLGLLLEKEGCTLYYASSKKNKIIRLSEMLYKTFIYRNKVDFVLIDTYSTYNFWYAFLVSQLCRILKIKYIPKLHGGDLPKRLLKNPRLCSMIFKNSHINIAPSAYLFEAFSNHGYSELVYIPNAIELQNYSLKVRKTLEPKLLWVRSFAAIYNPEMAVKVLFELKKDFPNAELCMVGPDKDGTLLKTKEVADELGVEVDFTGKLTKKQWWVLSQKYDIFINTTHFDNTPVSVIEALALGLPVISTNVGGIPYLLKDKVTALLVDDDDVAAMVKAIKEIMSNEELRDFMVLNSLHLIESFNWQVVKSKWHEILA